MRRKDRESQGRAEEGTGHGSKRRQQHRRLGERKERRWETSCWKKICWPAPPCAPSCLSAISTALTRVLFRSAFSSAISSSLSRSCSRHKLSSFVRAANSCPGVGRIRWLTQLFLYFSLCENLKALTLLAIPCLLQPLKNCPLLSPARLAAQILPLWANSPFRCRGCVS